MEYNWFPDSWEMTQPPQDQLFNWPWTLENLYNNPLPQEDGYPSLPPVAQSLQFQLIPPQPFENIGISQAFANPGPVKSGVESMPESTSESIPGWGVSSSGSEESHSRNISSVNTPASLEMLNDQRKRKREDSSSCEATPDGSQTRKATRKPSSEAAREKTKAIRGDKACLPCQLEKRGCTPINIFDPQSPCDRCSKRLTAPGRIVLCCRVNITDLGIFRGGPTQDLSQTLRYIIVGASPDQARSRQLKKLTDADRRSAASSVKQLRLTQGYGPNTLNLKVQQYNPKDGDKVDYTWRDEFDDEERYECPHYALADLEHVQISLERFLKYNIPDYIRDVLKNADPITRKVFEAALTHSEESKLVELVLRFWVASRFIETPWRIHGDETLGMAPDWRESSPYYSIIPVTPIMDQQIDNIIIFHLLEPLWTNIRKILRKKLLENKKADWFELQLALFILLNHVEQTMAHDIDFSNRHSLTTRFSNPPLIGKVVHAAETLLKYYHNPGINMYYPFHAEWKRVTADYGWTEELNIDSHESQKIEMQKQYVLAIRSMLQTQRQSQMPLKPGMPSYWTIQLYRNEWTPGIVNAYA